MRRLFRCARTTLLILALLVVVAGFFLNKVGLPEFVKQRVVAQLRAKGWEVEFSRLRLRWYRGLVAEDLQMWRADRQPGVRAGRPAAIDSSPCAAEAAIG